MAAGEKTPLVERLYVPVAPSATAVASSFIARVPFDGVVSAATYSTLAAITGAATNNRVVSVINHGQTGAGSTSIAASTYASGVNAVAFDENALSLSGTAANLVVASGDVLEVRSSVNGTGLADPGGTVTITLTRG